MSELPQGWAISRFSEVLQSIVGGGTPSKANPRYFSGSIPFMTVKDLHERFPKDTIDHISEEAVSDSATSLVPEDTLIVATRMSLGKIARPKFKTAINQDLKALFIVDGLDKTYVEYWWRSQSSLIQSLGTGTTVKGIRLEDIRGLEFLLAPTSEQKRIADKLDTLQARVDATRARLDRIPELLRRFRQSVLAAATSGQLTEDWRQEQSAKAAAVPVVPVHHGSDCEQPPPKRQAHIKAWQKVRLSEIGEFGRGKSKHRPRNDPRLFGGNYPFIQTGDVANSNGFIKTHHQTYSDFGLQQSKLWPAGTLCITIAANIADTSILSYPTCFPDSVVGFVADEKKCLIQFVKWSIDVIKSDLESFAPATAQKNINLSVLSDIEFNIPSLVEQKEIVRRVEFLLVMADKLEARYATARAQVDKLTPALLAKAFRGELVPQDPSDEPAEQLLARLRATQDAAPTSSRRGCKKS